MGPDLAPDGTRFGTGWDPFLAPGLSYLGPKIVLFGPQDCPIWAHGAMLLGHLGAMLLGHLGAMHPFSGTPGYPLPRQPVHAPPSALSIGTVHMVSLVILAQFAVKWGPNVRLFSR